MKTYLECMPCFMKQALQAGKTAGDDPVLHKKIMDAVAEEIKLINMDDCPPKMGRRIHMIVKDMAGNSDPYRELKDKYNHLAMSMYPFLKEKIKNSDDPLLTAVRAAIAGNVIDFGAQLTFELDRDLEDVLYREFEIKHFNEFRQGLEKAREILYLGDNAGETVFDRVLIEEIKERYGVKIIYVVKEVPIINDATKEDAVFAGIDKIAEVISSGSDAPGTVLEFCSEKFNKMFKQAGFVISKGQGNYEALSENEKPIFFLFKVKCDVLAGDIGVPIGSIILKYSGKR